MRKILAAATLTLAIGGSAYAADAVYIEPTPAPIIVPPSVFDWTGPYAGIQAGYGWGNTGYEEPFANTGLNAFDTNPNGFFGGVFVGYNWQITPWVFGVEADINYAAIDDRQQIGPANFLETHVDWFGSARARAGIAADRALIFATAGVAFAHHEEVQEFAATRAAESDSVVGWTAGAGIEYAFTDQLAARVEYRYYDFQEGNYFAPGSAGAAAGFTERNVDLDMHTVSVGVSFRF